ncbi:hypothetical protein ACTA71_002521 [Dictyostelium dimigraforme]
MRIKYFFKDLIPFYNKPKLEIQRNLYYSFFVSINLTISVLFLVIPVFRNFFNVYFAVFNTLFVCVGVQSSESFYVLIKNQFRILLAVIIGLVVAYVSHILTFYHVWTSVFITQPFIFITSGVMIESKLLPYSLGKLMFIPYFNLVYFNNPPSRFDVVPFLKFLLTGVTPLFLVLVTGIGLNMEFSSTHFIQSSKTILKTNRKFVSIIEREFEIKTLEAINYPLKNSYQRNIVKNLTNRNGLDNKTKTTNNIKTNNNYPININNQNNNNNNNNNNNEEEEEEEEEEGEKEEEEEEEHKKRKISFQIPIFLKPKKQDPLSPLNEIVQKINFNDNGSPTSSLNTEFTTTSTIDRKTREKLSRTKPPPHLNLDGENQEAHDKHVIGSNEPPQENSSTFNRTHNFFKITMEKLNIVSSRNLNHMEKYLVEAKKEFWNKELFGYFNELSYLLETNHKKLLTINTAVLENIGSETSQTLLEILPHLNTLISTLVKIFKIMEKQIDKKYKPAEITPQLINDENFDTTTLFQGIDMKNISDITDLKKGKHFLRSTESIQRIGGLRKYKTLEYSQYKILTCFDCVDKTIKDINDILGEIYDPETSFSVKNIDEETRVNFLISAFKKFSKDQKVLASTVFLLSHSLWNKKSGRRQHLTMIRKTLSKWYNNILELKGKIKKEDYPRQFPQVHFTLKERVLEIWELIKKRVLVKWRYSLSFSIGVSVFSIVYYELKIHSNFILFRNLAWAVITYSLVSTPTVGALAFYSTLRVIGAVLGSILGYACAEIYSRTTDPGRAFIFVFSTFLCTFLSCVMTRAKSFEKLVTFFILSFVVVAFLAYPSNSPSIIISLFRMMHILFAVLLVLVISVLFSPFYEHKQLKTNLYQFPFKVTQSFNFLICNTLIDPNVIPPRSRPLFYRPSKFNYIQPGLPIEMNQKQFKELLSKQLNLLRYQIPIQRTLLFHSRYELLPFQKSKYYRLRRLLYTETKLFHSLLALEFITVSALPKKHLNEIGKLITNNLLKLMSELDYTTRSYMINIRSTLKDERIVQENQSKIICNEIARDIGEYIYKNRYDRESLNLLRYCSAIIFCLISFVDLFNLVFDKVVKLSSTSVLKRTDHLNITSPFISVSPPIKNEEIYKQQKQQKEEELKIPITEKSPHITQLMNEKGIEEIMERRDDQIKRETDIPDNLLDKIIDSTNDYDNKDDGYFNTTDNPDENREFEIITDNIKEEFSPTQNNIGNPSQ